MGRCIISLILLSSALINVHCETRESCPPLAPESSCSSTPRSVTAGQIVDGIHEGSMVVVDVRTVEERVATGKIPTSHSIPVAQIKEAFGLDAASFTAKYNFPKPAPEALVLHCAGGRRATAAWESVQEFGFCQARVYQGSMNDWLAQKLPTEPALDE